MSFFRERAIKAVRKARRCDACRHMIEVGMPALDMSGHYDGHFWSQTTHIECRSAEVALNKLHDTGYDDDWMNIGDDMEVDDWPWLIEEHPIVAQRMGITRARYDDAMQEREACRKAWAEIELKRKRREPVA